MYVWQLKWTPALRSALERTAVSMSRLHLLALEIAPDGRLREATVDFDLIRQLGRRVVPVIRIDGQASDLERGLGPALGVVQRWRGAGVAVDAVEIDFDCATARLDDYAAFLLKLRARLPAQVGVHITALPTWLASRAPLGRLVATADEVVLQLHAVRNPHGGLFAADDATNWLREFSKLATKPFKAALPTYGSKVVWAADGRVAVIESENAARLIGTATSELTSDPRQIAEFVRRIERQPPRGLTGFVWFRMPTAADRRAWSVETFLAVVEGRPLPRTVVAEFTTSATPGRGDIVLRNTGGFDSPLPRLIRIDARCKSADGVSGYLVQREHDAVRWLRASPAMLRAGSGINVGWASCEEGTHALNIEF